jgi:hypothetical protein
VRRATRGDLVLQGMDAPLHQLTSSRIVDASNTSFAPAAA